MTGRIEREEGVKERERESLQSVSSPFFFSPALCNPFLVIHSAASCSFAV